MMLGQGDSGQVQETLVMLTVKHQKLQQNIVLKPNKSCDMHELHFDIEFTK